MKRRAPHFFSGENFRFWFLTGFFLFFFGLILSKLFILQVVRGEELQEQAKEIRSSSIEISARRGGIFTLDSKTGEVSPLAINTTLYKVFVDAREEVTPEENLSLIAEFVTNELYTPEEFEKCIENAKWCPEGSVLEIKDEKDVVIHRIFPNYANAKKAFQEETFKKISEKRTSLIYATDVNTEILNNLKAKNFPHVYISEEEQYIQINFEGLQNQERKNIAQALKSFFGGDAEEIEKKLFIGRKGYVPILSRIKPEAREKILQKKREADKQYMAELNKYAKLKKAGSVNISKPKPSFLKSIGFEPEPLRYYPENNLLANVVGFVSNNKGSYGIEKYFNSFLSGEDGVFETSRDVHGNAVSIQKSDSEKVIDGGNVVLTIDRILQQRVEEILDEKVEEYKADSAQAILINPETGAILVMANSPRFDPNFFGNVYERRRTTPEDFETIYKTTPLEKKDREGNFIPADYEEFTLAWEQGFDPEFYMFDNVAGPAAYSNKTVSSIYEVGSTMKPLVMAAAIEEGEITANSSYFESAPLEVGDFTIRNADGEYLGWQTMTNIMERSANVGMAWIAGRMGKPVLHDSIKKLRFGEYTDINLPDELSGEVAYYNKWSDAKMYNASFGQGISSTPLQLVQAWTALANGGFMVNPRIVEYLEYADGTRKYKESTRQRIFSAETQEDMKKMLISSTENGVAKKGQVKGHYIAGKTGTSQIANTKGPGYEPLDIPGNTITSFIGFAPVDDPQFLLLVKFDRARIGEGGRSVYGSSTAAPTFSQIMKTVFFYYDTPRDKF
jgi:cell division protein FtsI/penicillin-binding protein 2